MGKAGSVGVCGKASCCCCGRLWDLCSNKSLRMIGGIIASPVFGGVSVALCGVVVGVLAMLLF